MVAVACACSAQDTRAGGPLPQFNGEYRITDMGRVESEPTEVIPALSRLSRLSNRVSQAFAPAAGSVVVAPAIGNEYAEWSIRIEDPDHEIRMLVGVRRSDGTYPVWRFEQAPAPVTVGDGTARVEGNELIADFALRDAIGERPILRERWRLIDDDRLEFSLESGPGEGKVKRVGGFTALRQ
jgi:hypothetical protein